MLFNWLGVQPAVGAGVQGSDDHPVAAPIQKGERKALVATGVMKRTEADQSDMPNRPRQPLFDLPLVLLKITHRQIGSTHRRQALGQHLGCVGSCRIAD